MGYDESSVVLSRRSTDRGTAPSEDPVVDGREIPRLSSCTRVNFPPPTMRWSRLLAVHLYVLTVQIQYVKDLFSILRSKDLHFKTFQIYNRLYFCDLSVLSWNPDHQPLETVSYSSAPSHDFLCTCLLLTQNPSKGPVPTIPPTRFCHTPTSVPLNPITVTLPIFSSLRRLPLNHSEPRTTKS